MAADVAIREFTAISVHVHADSIPDALKKLGVEIESREILDSMACMNVWISEPTIECGEEAKQALCALALYADPQSGRMLA